LIAQRWDSALAARAQAWASKCLQPGGLSAHSPGDDPAVRIGGENLAWATHKIEPAAMVRLWFAEITDEPGHLGESTVCSKVAGNVDGSFGDCALRRTRLGMPIGHFTQMIWHSHSRLGCGFAECDTKYAYLLVCHYADDHDNGYCIRADFCKSNSGNYVLEPLYHPGMPCQYCQHHCQRGLCTAEADHPDTCDWPVV